MQRKRIAAIASIAAIAALGWSSLVECAWGQSNCKQVKGDLFVITQPGTSTGTITNGGDFNGTITMVDTVSAGFDTPDPFVVSYTQDLIISTHEGQLTATSVSLFDFSKLPSFGVVSTLARIGPTSAKTDNAASTGRFAGATGFYFINGFGTPNGAGGFIGQAQITGQICYAGNGGN
jgi:hypothetical protein